MQQLVGTLPHGAGYGYARSYEDNALLPGWGDVVEQSLERSRKRVLQAGHVDVKYIDRVRALAH